MSTARPLDLEIRTVYSASREEMRTGLLAYVDLVAFGLLRIGVTIRRRAENGSIYVAFPAPQGPDGRSRSVVRPVDRSARERLEREILQKFNVHPAAAQEMNDDT